MKDNLQVGTEHGAALTIDSDRTIALPRVVFGVGGTDARDLVGRTKKAARVRAAAQTTR